MQLGSAAYRLTRPGAAPKAEGHRAVGHYEHCCESECRAREIDMKGSWLLRHNRCCTPQGGGAETGSLLLELEPYARTETV